MLFGNGLNLKIVPFVSWWSNIFPQIHKGYKIDQILNDLEYFYPGRQQKQI